MKKLGIVITDGVGFRPQAAPENPKKRMACPRFSRMGEPVFSGYCKFKFFGLVQ